MKKATEWLPFFVSDWSRHYIKYITTNLTVA
jgi:hypothetical protein